MVADVVAAYPEGLTSQTIAALMGVSKTLVKETAAKARAKVRAQVEAKGER